MRGDTAKSRSGLSFTAFVITSLAKAIESNPRVQAYRDWRGRLVVFKDVDVVTMIEPEPGAVAIPHIIRAANRKTTRECSDEIRLIQTQPEKSRQSNGLRLGKNVPWFARRLFYLGLRKNPLWLKRAAGTTVVTSVGMFGDGGGWGIGFLPMHSLGVVVGGISQKPSFHKNTIQIREHLNLTISFDHDTVDGAPAARFTNTLRRVIESASVLSDLPPMTDPNAVDSRYIQPIS